MPCPFARYAPAAALALTPEQLAAHYSSHASHHHHDASHASSSSQYPLLSEHLKHATAKAHREVESSAGVRKLMGFGKGGSVDEDDGKVFGRLDYVRWMIMLGCIYAALESPLLSQDAAQAPMLAPLLEAVLPDQNVASTSTSTSVRLLPHLLRLPAILRDVHVHLQILARSSGNEEGAGLDWAELVEESNEQIQAGDRDIYDELARCLSITSQPSLIAAALPSSSSSSPELTTQHLRLLSPTEAESSLVYVKRLQALPHASGDLLLSHAYVRYLGDLSGGQHIRKRVEKLFPLDDDARSATTPAGYEFYDFPRSEENDQESDAAWHRRLKDAFRVAMDSSIASAIASSEVFNSPGSASHSTISRVLFRRSAETSHDQLVTRLLSAQGSEASLAFELNKDLFEGLIGARPVAILGAIPTTLQQQQQAQRPTPYTATSDFSLSSSSASSVMGDETDTDFSASSYSSEDESAGRKGGEAYSLLEKHINLALHASSSSPSGSASGAALPSVIFASASTTGKTKVSSGCPVTRAKNAIAAASPLIATALLVGGSVVLLRAALST
ncbi:hypothetical protein BCV69DRAFT_275276 [Microstroma glucosiphilum]|uniref:Heme oxygenase-like protein n=1 Tax=Pseudomicrostroma glucosiphilum TaxID=1684307 RepID=A0A316UF45_9BASI|nr:hypothetical protein BCV69DRAFT_275276 [Pseudomicrostroma glucosiphilum]PWN23869.1 hypothetical protein BCV69DRAFT_275276 [Pseudomicrostroma glucosiphilum]